MEQLEAASGRQEMLTGELTEVENSMRALMASRDEQVAHLDAELATHQGSRDAIAAEIPVDLLTLYDKIRVRAGGLGAAALKGRRCSGCQLEITHMALAEFLAAPADDVLRCEECERVLVRIDPVGA